MVGQTIRHWRVIAIDPHPGIMGYWCECTCGRSQRWISKYELLHGKSTGCVKCHKHNTIIAQLTEEEIKSIREWAAKGLDIKYLAQQYRVRTSTINHIIRRQDNDQNKDNI